MELDGVGCDTVGWAAEWLEVGVWSELGVEGRGVGEAFCFRRRVREGGGGSRLHSLPSLPLPRIGAPPQWRQTSGQWLVALRTRWVRPGHKKDAEWTTSMEWG